MKQIRRSWVIVSAVTLAVATLTQCAPPVAEREPGSFSVAWWGNDNRHEPTLAAIQLLEETYPGIVVVPEYYSLVEYWDVMAARGPRELAGRHAAGLRLPFAVRRERVAAGPYHAWWNGERSISETCMRAT